MVVTIIPWGLTDTGDHTDQIFHLLIQHKTKEIDKW